jgi:DNA-binding beta-propeller fold protein YncE
MKGSTTPAGAALALALVLAAGPTAAAAPSYLMQWGSRGGGSGQFDDPEGVAVDAMGHVFVADFYNGLIQKFDTNGAFLAQWNRPGWNPWAIAVDGSGNVLAAGLDHYYPALQRFTGAGVPLPPIVLDFGPPCGIALDASGNLYVVDTNNHGVEKLDASGHLLFRWGSLGAGPGQFKNPAGVAVDVNGNIFVTDTYNHRIQKFTGAGIYLAQWGGLGSGPGQFRYPWGIAIGPDGTLYVTDDLNHRIQQFRLDGSYLSQWGGLGAGAGQFKNPLGVAIDAQGYLYVADTGNYRIQKFGLAPTPVKVTSWGRIKSIYRGGDSR